VGTARYTAFLSYSHKDAATARWLHRRLETYRIPRRLAGTIGERGAVPVRLTPIFRDREELPAAGNLSEKVRAALAASDNLVILCSPHAAASLWVAREIAAFREMHPDRPVFAAIVEGEPASCFPANLAADGAEPLAADLRPGRDGRRLGLLKLIAGLAGLDLDALVQRDSQRRIRRVTAVTAGAIAGMVIMTFLAVFALQARAEAERQRAAAEGQIEFMLTDLRTRLRGVGRLDIMQAVNARALRYYQEQGDLRRLPADSLLRRARILNAIGDDDLTRGTMTAALAAFEEARRTTAEQLARHPNDPDHLLQNARSEYRIGRVYELRRDWPAAQRQYARLATAAERLVALEPRNPDYMREVASSAIDLGNVQMNGMRDTTAAQGSYEKALLWLGRAAKTRPLDRDIFYDEADAYAWLADAFFTQGRWRENLASRLQQYRITGRLYRAVPADAGAAFRFALAQRAVGDAYAKLGDRDRARPQLFQAYRSAKQLELRDPKNSDWLLFGGSVGCDLYYRDLGLPKGVVRSDVRRAINKAWTTLLAENNPRASDLTRCAKSMNRQNA
jgi:tetratricopeptide (TPR) repeat protein